MRIVFAALVGIGLSAGFPAVSLVRGDEPAAKPAEVKASSPIKAEAESSESAKSSSSSAAASAPKPKYPPHAEVLKEFTPIDGLIRLYHKDSKVFAEIETAHFNRDFIVLISIARGISEGQLLGGMSWGFGDDWLWQFKKVDDNIHVIRRNVRFKAGKGTPEERAVRLAYTDSVMFALPIVTMGPKGGAVVDFSQIFMSDLPQIGMAMPGFSFSPSKSTWAEVKGFKDNIELQVAAVYGAPPNSNFDTVADSRGVSINVHYSISTLPETGYQPRLADDRVGYFLTAVKDFSKKGPDDNFVRYINRWDLQKADSGGDLSPPKKPIVFWLEKTIPFQYRKPIGDGILEWNKAFEKAGIVNAIEVRQQPDNADWDPEDINYNTFRWITAGAGFAMGPSRVNPMTGQILDADIIFDADFIRFWKMELETFTPAGIAAMTGGPVDLDSFHAAVEGLPQSGTGQASLYTGVNAATLAGRHYGPHAPTAAYPVLASHGMWARLQDRGVTAERLAFATAYPERFFAYGERTGRWPTAARMARACGVRLRSEQDVRDGTAFTAEITGEAWRERLGLNVPVHTPSEAGRLLASLAAAHTVTLYEYYDTDTVGHSRELERAAEVLARVDAFLGGLLDAFDVDRGLILVTSDHGNLEDLSVKTHTRNPVPLVAWGTGAGAFAACQALTDVTPTLVALMTEAS